MFYPLLTCRIIQRPVEPLVFLFGHRLNSIWLTVVSTQEPDGVELVLEPDDNPASKVFKKAIYEQGIPFTALQSDDIQKDYERMKALGVRFTQEPTQMGPVTQAVFDDICGNFSQICQV